jgi:glycosyltransferase involved in cell wall biosynthesis
VKVLHVEGGRNLYGGAQQVLYLLQGLKRRGVKSALVCPAGSDLAQAAEPFADVYPVPMAGDLDLRIISRMRRCIRACRPDIVHLHSRIGADVMGGIACRLEGVPVVHSRRQDNPEARWAVALKYRLHDRVIAISEGIGNILLAEGLPPAKLRVVRSAVDWERFARPCRRAEVCERLTVGAEARLVGVVAQLIERKGHRFLIEALPPLLGEFPDLRVFFFGKGPAEENLRRRIEAVGLGHHILLAGFRTDLPDILPCLDLLVHPATMEGLGVSLLQASSAGVPVIASDAGGIPEAVRDGVNGLLVPPGDVPALRAAMATLLRDQSLAQRLGEGGAELMRREFSADTMAEGNLTVYQELVPESSLERA